MTLAPGTRLGTYRILAPLGAGGMGEVYRARDTRLERDIALKVLSEAVSRDPDRLARFEREARMAAGLTHPNIVVLHSIEDIEGTRIITMELVEGESLDRRIEAKGMAVDQLLRISTALAEALVGAHAMGIVHRDLKPANVMVASDGRVKVLDFGLAKIPPKGAAISASQVPTADLPLSIEGQVVGTLPYMAPEQVRGDVVDARTDLFALGVVMYELASGRRPFAGRTFADLGSTILRDAPKPLAELRGDLPRGFAAIVERCLSKEPGDRFPSAVGVRDALQSVSRSLNQTAGPKESKGTPSIAVLPFVNMSRDEENEYFSDGLAEELLNVLAKIPELKVTGRTSSFAFKGKLEDLRDIGQKLGVGTLLEGSVRKAGNRVRITAQLIKVADGFHLWSETYDRVLDDIFAVQEDIARSVSRALHVTLLGKPALASDADAETYPLLLQANHFLWQNTGPSTSRAISLYRQVIDKNPGNARAWASLAMAHFYQAGYGHASVKESVRLGKAAAERALALDGQLPEAHIAVGVALASFEFRFQEGMASVRRAMELAPGRSMVMTMMSMYEGALGDLNESLRLARRIQELDPLSAEAHSNRGRSETWASNLEAACEAYDRCVELSPNRTSVHATLGLLYLRRGMHERALEEILKEGPTGYRHHALAIAYHVLGRKAESDEAMAQLLAQGEDWAIQLASAHVIRGEADEAFRWLERAYALRDSGIVTLKVTSSYRGLHADPRWPAFLEKVGLV